MFGLAFLKGPALLAGAGALLLLSALAGWVAVLRADVRVLEAEKATLEAQAIAFDIACKSNTERLESGIALQNAATEAREREMEERASAIADAEKASQAAADAHDAAIREITAATPIIDESLEGTARDLAVCKWQWSRLRVKP